MIYDEIIDLPHFEPKRPPRMSMSARAAQFAPFSALEGHEDALEETARVTTEKVSLSKDEKNELSKKIDILLSGVISLCSIRYFVADKMKSGGEYRTIKGIVKKVDIRDRKIFLAGGVVVDMDNISQLTLYK